MARNHASTVREVIADTVHRNVAELITPNPGVSLDYFMQTLAVHIALIRKSTQLSPELPMLFVARYPLDEHDTIQWMMTKDDTYDSITVKVERAIANRSLPFDESEIKW